MKERSGPTGGVWGRVQREIDSRIPHMTPTWAVWFAGEGAGAAGAREQRRGASWGPQM